MQREDDCSRRDLCLKRCDELALFHPASLDAHLSRCIRPPGIEIDGGEGGMQDKKISCMDGGSVTLVSIGFA